jgi:hypothetical protein
VPWKAPQPLRRVRRAPGDSATSARRGSGRGDAPARTVSAREPLDGRLERSLAAAVGELRDQRLEPRRGIAKRRLAGRPGGVDRRVAGLEERDPPLAGRLELGEREQCLGERPVGQLYRATGVVPPHRHPRRRTPTRSTFLPARRAGSGQRVRILGRLCARRSRTRRGRRAREGGSPLRRGPPAPGNITSNRSVGRRRPARWLMSAYIRRPSACSSDSSPPFAGIPNASRIRRASTAAKRSQARVEPDRGLHAELGLGGEKPAAVVGEPVLGEHLEGSQQLLAVHLLVRIHGSSRRRRTATASVAGWRRRRVPRPPPRPR